MFCKLNWSSPKVARQRLCSLENLGSVFWNR
jgi:hypothetical protein